MLCFVFVVGPNFVFVVGSCFVIVVGPCFVFVAGPCFVFVVLSVFSSFAIIFLRKRKRELITIL